MRDLSGLTASERKEYLLQERAREVEAAMEPVMKLVNGSSVGPDDIARFIMNEHPTLVGQLVKGVALGVMRRTMYDSNWKPYDPTIGKGRRMACLERLDKPEHPEHDGRFSCDTVIGAELMARQGFI
jgi:hypothetical protein